MHDLRQQRAVGNTRCQNVKEERVGALVAQDKGNALFIGRDDALWKTVDAFLAKQMMGDKRGHNDPFDFIRCHPLCPPRAHAKPAVVNGASHAVCDDHSPSPQKQNESLISSRSCAEATVCPSMR